MRLVNDSEDKQSKENKNVLESVSFFALLFYALICALGFSSVFMSPFALILAHRRLPDFWPKVAGISGALLALLFLDVPQVVLVFTFVFSVFVADGVQRQVPFWRLLSLCGVLAFCLGLLGLVTVSGGLEPSLLISSWASFVEKVVAQAQQNGMIKSGLNWDELRRALFYQGPFYFISGALLSVWFSIGLAAHLKWQEDSDLYSGINLRRLKLPAWFSFLVLGAWGLSLLNNNTFSRFLAGPIQLGFLALSIQGTVLLSLFLNRKNCRAWLRGLVYSFFIFLGFYALAGLGLMSPLILIRKKRLKESL